MANDDGVFGVAAARLDAVPVTYTTLLAVLLTLVALVTVVAQPRHLGGLPPARAGAVGAAARRGRGALPLPVLRMSNSASLLLPGSNLTNLLVLEHEQVSGARFAARMAPAWLAAVGITAVVVLVLLVLNRPTEGPAPPPSGTGRGGPPVPRLGFLGARRRRGPDAGPPTARAGGGRRWPRRRRVAGGPARLGWRFGVEGVDAAVLTRSVRLRRRPRHPGPGLGRPGHTIGHLRRVGVGGGRRSRGGGPQQPSPAVLFAARRPPHPRALLIGLNLGSNLAVSSLSALLRHRAAKAVGAEPCAARVSRLGVVAPLSIAAGLALKAFTPHHL